jgi:hypothetical protein
MVGFDAETKEQVLRGVRSDGPRVVSPNAGAVSFANYFER